MGSKGVVALKTGVGVAGKLLGTAGIKGLRSIFQVV